VVGLLFAGVFLAFVFAYACTEFLLGRLDARRRVLVGESRVFLIILAANLASFAILWLSSLLFLAASDAPYYLQATLVTFCAQAVWLAQHVWFYYRDHPRLRYER
jgi:hypothetical protein